MTYTYKHIFFINLPVLMSILIEQLVNITDAIFLGHVGEIEIGASAIASIYYLAIYMLGFGLSLGLQILIARRNGEKKYNKTGEAFFQGLYLFVFLSIVFFVFSMAFSPYIMQFLISSAEIYDAVQKYLDWRCFGLLFAFPSLAFRSFLVGIIKTRILGIGAVCMVTSNIVLNYLLIFGNYGFPRLGIAGAAIASSLSEAIPLFIFIIYVYKRVDKSKYGLKVTFNKDILIKVFRLSSWSMLQSFISVAPWFLFFISIEHLGKDRLAIANIIRSISTLFFVIVNSLATTTASLVSNMIGNNEKEKVIPLCRQIIRLGYFIGVPLIILGLLFQNQALGIYTNNQILINGAHATYIVMLLNYFIAVPGYIYSNAIIGTGNTKKAFRFQVITIIIYLLYLHMINNIPDIPLVIYWCAEILFVFMLFTLSYVYMRKGKWQNELI